MSLQLDIKSKIIQSPQELYDLLASALKLAASIYIQKMLHYIEQHTTKGGSQWKEPKGTIPFATGALLTSMQHIVSGSHATGLEVEFQYGVGVDYWKWVDQPRAEGHFPPKGPIAAWAAMVGIPQIAVPLIQWSIYHKGWPGRQFWAPFAREANRAWKDAIEEAFQYVNVPFTWSGGDIIV